VKSVFFLLFLFAVGYGVGPQFFQGLAREGPRQIAFAVIVLAFCLVVPLICAKLAGLDLGYAAGLYAGSQTISASIGVATDQIMRLGLPAEQAKAYVDKIPIGYAVTYIYGTIGSALVLAKLGPWLLGIDLPKACADYEKQMGAGGDGQNTMSARRNWEVRAYVLEPGMPVVGKTVAQAEASETRGRLLVERIRRGNEILEWKPDLVLQAGDVVAVAGRRDLLVNLLSDAPGRSTTRRCSTFPSNRPTFTLPTRRSPAGLWRSSARGRQPTACSCARSRATWSRSRSFRTPKSTAAISSL
jgi:putative transport protein